MTGYIQKYVYIFASKGVIVPNGKTRATSHLTILSAATLSAILYSPRDYANDSDEQENLRMGSKISGRPGRRLGLKTDKNLLTDSEALVLT